MIGQLIDARRVLIQNTDLGPVAATIHAPLFWLVGYRQAESLAAMMAESQTQLEDN